MQVPLLKLTGAYVWLLRDAASDSAQGFLHGAERWQSFCVWLSTQTRSVPTRSASGSLRQTWPWREGLYYGALAPAFPPVVPNFFTTRKCQGWRVLSFFLLISPQDFPFQSHVWALGLGRWENHDPVWSRNTSVLSVTPSKSICPPNTAINEFRAGT